MDYTIKARVVAENVKIYYRQSISFMYKVVAYSSCEERVPKEIDVISACRPGQQESTAKPLLPFLDQRSLRRGPCAGQPLQCAPCSRNSDPLAGSRHWHRSTGAAAAIDCTTRCERRDAV
jgi:hypothetical protein